MTPPPGSPAAQSARNNGYSLLYQLLDDEKDVSLLSLIKREHADVKGLIKQIATASGAGAKVIEQFAKEDRSINLHDTQLPPGETATRTAIGATKKKALLHNKGSDFELNLLLTQTEALNYGWHLAEVTSKNETEPNHARALAGLAAEMHNLYNAVIMQLLSKKW